jgi:AcrR family transcriptional regulator
MESAATMSEEVIPQQDGRVARRLGNRARILDALFELIRAGKFHPTLKEIAEQAGVTPRTLLNHFPDVASLLLAAAAHGRDRAAEMLPEVPDHPDPVVRVEQFFERAAAFYDAYSAVRWATLTSAHVPVTEMRQTKGFVLARMEARVMELIAGFGVSVGDDHSMHNCLKVVIDPLAWRLLRVQQELSRVDAARSMALNVCALARAAALLTTATPSEPS